METIQHIMHSLIAFQDDTDRLHDLTDVFNIISCFIAIVCHILLLYCNVIKWSLFFL